jgi:hypothetical protein
MVVQISAQERQGKSVADRPAWCETRDIPAEAVFLFTFV